MAQKQSKKFVGVARGKFSSDLASAFLPESENLRSVADVARALGVDPLRVHQSTSHYQPQYQIYFSTPQLTLEAVARFTHLGLCVYLPSWLFSSPKWLSSAASSKVTDIIKEIIHLAKSFPRRAVGETFIKALRTLSGDEVGCIEDAYSLLLRSFRLHSQPQQWSPLHPIVPSVSPAAPGSVAASPSRWAPLPSYASPPQEALSQRLEEIFEQNKALLVEMEQLKHEVACLRAQRSGPGPQAAVSAASAAVSPVPMSSFISLSSSVVSQEAAPQSTPIIAINSGAAQSAERSASLVDSVSPSISVGHSTAFQFPGGLTAASPTTTFKPASSDSVPPSPAAARKRRRRANRSARASPVVTRAQAADPRLLGLPTRCVQPLCGKRLDRSSPDVEFCWDCEGMVEPSAVAIYCSDACLTIGRGDGTCACQKHHCVESCAHAQYDELLRWPGREQVPR